MTGRRTSADEESDARRSRGEAWPSSRCARGPRSGADVGREVLAGEGGTAAARVVVQDQCLNSTCAAFRRQVTRMLLRGGSHPADDGDPIDWFRGEIAKSPIPTLTGLRDAPLGAGPPSSQAGLGTVSRSGVGGV